MLITIPGDAYGGAVPTSVLDLDPLIHYARHSGPDAIRLMPPQGPDDQPNGAALMAIKERLEAHGLQAVAGGGDMFGSRGAPDPRWQIGRLFEARAMVAALGEAGVEPLTLHWGPRVTDAHWDAGCDFLERLLEEAERAQVRLAIAPGAEGPSPEMLHRLFRHFASPCLGAACTIGLPDVSPRTTVDQIRALGSKLMVVAVRPVHEEGAETATLRDERGGLYWTAVGGALREIGYSGVVLLDGFTSPTGTARAIGFLRGVLARAG